MPRIKATRSFAVESLYNFNQAALQAQKEGGFVSADDLPESKSINTEINEQNPVQDGGNIEGIVNMIPPKNLSKEKEDEKATQPKGKESSLSGRASIAVKSCKKDNGMRSPLTCRKEGLTNSKKQLTASKATLTKHPEGAKSDSIIKKTCGTPHLAQENQAIKRQKLEGGKSRQILNPKPRNMPHKTKMGIVNGSSNLCSSTVKTSQKDNRKIYIREQAVPFVSMAEMMNKFHSSTRELSLSSIHNAATSHNKCKLRLTRPKDPEFVTSQRIRPVRIKSSVELEEEMMAKIPKFKARPLNRKILETASVPVPQRSVPRPPEFKEFHLETMVRAAQNSETSSTISAEPFTKQHEEWKKNYLTEPKSPRLHTTLRARPTKVKSSLELEQEELEKVPQFKARPLNKKIFESKGELGIFCNTKKHITVPEEFHFATDERIPPPNAVVELFDKMSLNSEYRRDNQIPRTTTPNPFNLRTEARGSEKERRLFLEVIHKQLEGDKARIPKANPYPYTTDYPVVPPKPEPKQCTKPEPFHLESLSRHEEEMRKEMQERLEMEREAAQRRIFKARPILKEDPVPPVPERPRRPLTEIQEFNLQLETRCAERADFDHKIKEKEMMYKRFREESEAQKMAEEEKALKQLRRTMVPHARPLPNFANPFLPQKSTKVATKAKSPKLRVLQGKERKTHLHRTPAQMR